MIGLTQRGPVQSPRGNAPSDTDLPPLPGIYRRKTPRPLAHGFLNSHTTFTMADETTNNLRSATTGFDALFANDLAKAREVFKATDSPFHALGAGVCAFLEAALGMEVRISATLCACCGTHLQCHTI